MGGLSPWHILIVLLVVVLLFGSKKLPDAARGLGRSMRIFKSEVKELTNDGDEQQESQQLPAGGQQSDAGQYGVAPQHQQPHATQHQQQVDNQGRTQGNNQGS